jgi:formylglycine-generating enzyme required for sulfatase activity
MVFRSLKEGESRMKKALTFSLLLYAVLGFAVSFSAERQVKLIPREGAEPRRALVIGNNDYDEGRLANAVNDARAMKNALESLGFEVTYRENLDMRGMKEVVRDFGDQLRGGGVGLFYYAGHGMQIKGSNFLMPIKASIKCEADVEYECYPADRVITTLEEAKNRLNIVVLDACRNNPFSRLFTRSGGSGLASMQPGEGMLIAFAAMPGKTASDGPGMKNGLFTYYLVETLGKPGLSLGEVFQETRNKVYEASHKEQRPNEFTNIIGDFEFFPAVKEGKAKFAEAYKPVLPSGGGADLSELKKEAEKNREAKEKERREWSDWQGRFERAVSEAKALEQDPNLSAASKKKAWEKVQSGYPDDNPYGTKDDDLRQYAEGRISALDGKIAEEERLAEERRQQEEARQAEAERKAEERRQAEAVRQAQAEARRQEAARKAAAEKKAAARPQQVAMGTMPSMITNSKDGSELIMIPAGEFLMGSNDYDSEKPPHRVYLSAYYIGKYEVTNEQFARFVNETGYNAGGDWKKYYTSGRENHPVVCVSWNDAKAYCNWANLRLPTEAEWEKAARGTDGRKYPWGNEWEPSYLNWSGEGDRKWNSWKGNKISSQLPTEPVGSYSNGVSPYGCMDMAGNVWEWCNDWYGEKYYSQSPSSDPQGPSSGDARILRGGSWLNGSAVYLRCAYRGRDLPGLRGGNLGFRVCRSANTR